MVKGRNDATSCEGTYEVVEQHVCVYSLVGLVDKARTTELVEKNGCLSPQLLKLMREILRDVSNLHARGKAHGHLCPENILICWERCKTEGQKALRYYAVLRPGCGNSDWRASIPHHGHETWEKDMCDLGEIFFYCITGVRKMVHENKIDLSMVDCCPEALHLISLLLNLNPIAGPKAIELLQHPLFWNSEKRLSFLRDISERVGDPPYSDLLEELRQVAVERIIVGKSWNQIQCQTWQEKIDDSIISHMKKKSVYDYCSVRDLIRFIRNMMAHYGQLPEHIQQSVGTLHDGFDSYFASRFPKLLIEVYKCVYKCCKEDGSLRKYFDDRCVFCIM